MGYVLHGVVGRSPIAALVSADLDLPIVGLTDTETWRIGWTMFNHEMTASCKSQRLCNPQHFSTPDGALFELDMHRSIDAQHR